MIPHTHACAHTLLTLKLNRVASYSVEANLEAQLKTLGSEVRNLQLQYQAQHQEFKDTEIQRSSNQGILLREINDRTIRICLAQQQAEIAYEQRTAQQEIFMRESITHLHTSQRRLDFKLDIVAAAHIANAAEREIRGEASRTTASPPFTQILAPVRDERCTSKCTCICHRRIAQRSSKRLQYFFGSLFLGYSGIPIITPACDSASCISRSSPVLRVMYIFPPWMVSRAILSTAKVSTSQGLELNIRMSHAISPSSRIFNFSVKGNVDGMRDLLQRRVGSPYDLDSSNNYTPLMVR